MKSYGLVDFPTNMTASDDWDPESIGGLAPGWMLMNELWPNTRPDRFGDWIARSTGAWEWVAYPDPPFDVVFHEGKLKNLDTMAEISQETLPGNIAARVAALEALVLPPSS